MSSRCVLVSFCLWVLVALFKKLSHCQLSSLQPLISQPNIAYLQVDVLAAVTHSSEALQLTTFSTFVNL